MHRDTDNPSNALQNTSLSSAGSSFLHHHPLRHYNHSPNNKEMPLIYKASNQSLCQQSTPSERVKEEASLAEDSSVSLAEENKEIMEGRWNEEQNFRFVIFVNYFQEIFANRYKRKSLKIFRNMSEFLVQRTAAQCRSHFQKLMLKYRTIPQLRKHYKTMVGEQRYKDEFQRFKTEWEATHLPSSNTLVEVKSYKSVEVQTDEQPPCSKCSSSETLELPVQPQPIYRSSLPVWQETTQLPVITDVNFIYMLSMLGYPSYLQPTAPVPTQQ